MIKPLKITLFPAKFRDRNFIEIYLYSNRSYRNCHFSCIFAVYPPPNQANMQYHIVTMDYFYLPDFTPPLFVHHYGEKIKFS
ncbi:MAG: hypothetical protein A7316_03320 [Candidatus Altiarchaeales archaeon WOR_SM1_86-2]|nr:MAG: hypothetical protein A7316_03320 [Candidatus Altiarchaeales archaeon WOR_SM1_86-2]